MEKLKFLFEVSGRANGATLTFVFTRDVGVYEDDKFIVDFFKLKTHGYDGFFRVNNIYANYCVCYKSTGGMKTSVDVDKRYVWDKEEVICNQKVNYYCSKGWAGSVMSWLKDIKQ